MIALKNILVATDFGPASEAALTYGRELAGAFGATLHVLHVLENVFLHAIVADPHSMEVAARRRIEGIFGVGTEPGDKERGGTPVRVRAITEISDEPAEAITRCARTADIDLIILGTHGRQRLPRLLLGSVAEAVVRTAPCPVLTVHHPEHGFVVQHERAKEHSQPA